MSKQTNSTDIHPSSAIVSGGGRGVSYELKTAGASPCPAAGTCERDASLSSSKDGLEGMSGKSAETTSLEVTAATNPMKEDDIHVMKEDDSYVMEDDDEASEFEEIQKYVEKFKSEDNQKKLDENQKDLEEQMEIKEKELERKKMTKAGKRFKRKQIGLDNEEIECARWFQTNKEYEPPTPKYLLLEDAGEPKYSAAHVFKRTAWMAQALDIRTKAKIPDMRRVNIQGVNYISIHVEDPKFSKKLMETSQLGPCAVRINKDQRKNCSYGVIRDHEEVLADMSEAAITEMMCDCGVIHVMQFTKGKEQAPTISYKLTFDNLICPLEITTLDKRHYEVTEYVPPPLRCFNCQKYNHAISKCRNIKTPTCQRCSVTGHQNRVFNKEGKLISQCTQPKKCFHCAGNHEAGDKECKIQAAEKKINEMIILKKISRKEARMQVLAQVGTSRRPAADVVTVQEQSRERKEQEREKQVFDTITTKVDAYLEGKAQAESAALTQLKEKVDQLLSAGKSNATPDSQDPDLEKRIEEKILQKFATRFESMEDTIKKQGEDIKRLQNDKAELEKVNKTLEKKLEEEKKTKEKVMKELEELKKNNRKRVLSDLSSDNNKAKKSDSSQTSVVATKERTMHTAESSFLNNSSSSSRGSRGGGRGTSSAKARGGHQLSHSQPDPRRPNRSGSGAMDVDHRKTFK